MSDELTCVALIPARRGSKRVPGKNIRELRGKPLLQYSVEAALACGFFSEVVVSTDCPRTLAIAEQCGATPLQRPEAIAGDSSPDIDWVRHALGQLGDFDCFSILRPTSPFRSPETLARAWRQWKDAGTDGYDSLRAVEPCAQHPGKMWRVHNNTLVPLLLQPETPAPWHSQQYAALPQVFVQNASLEIAWTATVVEKGSIAGDMILPFFTRELEGFDINTELDWLVAELMLEKGIRDL